MRLTRFNRRHASTLRSAVVPGRAIAAVLLALVFPLPVRAQGVGLSFDRVVAAEWHTAYSGLKRTTLFSPQRAVAVEARVVQTENGRRMVTIVNPPRRAGETQVDDGDYLWHYIPARNTVSIGRTQVGRHPYSDKVGKRPFLSPNGQEAIAGRPSVIYNVIPFRPQAPTLRWWVDNESFVPLRTELTTRDGKQVTEEYEQISFGPQPPIQFNWPAGAILAVRTWTADGQRGPTVQVDMPLALPVGLPPAVVFDGIWLRDLVGRQVLWLHFHRGANEVSLFETTRGPRSDVPQGDGVDNWNLGALNITMVSNLPAAGRLRFQRSVQLAH